MIVRSFPRDEIAARAAAELVSLAQNAVENRGVFSLVLTGGGLGIELASQLSDQEIPWHKMNTVFSDERYVALEHGDRNEHQAVSACGELIKTNFLRYPDVGDNLEFAQHQMNLKLEREFGPVDRNSIVFDLVVLGVGPDGHIASLFPGRSHPISWVVGESSSPKPPSARLSLSYEALNRSRKVWFLAGGTEKADAVRNAMKSRDLPAGKIKGEEETVWWLDQELSDAL